MRKLITTEEAMRIVSSGGTVWRGAMKYTAGIGADCVIEEHAPITVHVPWRQFTQLTGFEVEVAKDQPIEHHCGNCHGHHHEHHLDNRCAYIARLFHPFEVWLHNSQTGEQIPAFRPFPPEMHRNGEHKAWDVRVIEVASKEAPTGPVVACAATHWRARSERCNSFGNEPEDCRCKFGKGEP